MPYCDGRSHHLSDGAIDCGVQGVITFQGTSPKPLMGPIAELNGKDTLWAPVRPACQEAQGLST